MFSRSTTSHAYSFLNRTSFLASQGVTDDVEITFRVGRHNHVELRDSQKLKPRLRGATHSGKNFQTLCLKVSLASDIILTSHGRIDNHSPIVSTSLVDHAYSQMHTGIKKILFTHFFRIPYSIESVPAPPIGPMMLEISQKILCVNAYRPGMPESENEYL